MDERVKTGSAEIRAVSKYSEVEPLVRKGYTAVEKVTAEWVKQAQGAAAAAIQADPGSKSAFNAALSGALNKANAEQNARCPLFTVAARKMLAKFHHAPNLRPAITKVIAEKRGTTRRSTSSRWWSRVRTARA